MQTCHNEAAALLGDRLGDFWDHLSEGAFDDLALEGKSAGIEHLTGTVPARFLGNTEHGFAKIRLLAGNNAGTTGIVGWPDFIYPGEYGMACGDSENGSVGALDPSQPASSGEGWIRLESDQPVQFLKHHPGWPKNIHVKVIAHGKYQGRTCIIPQEYFLKTGAGHRGPLGVIPPISGN